MAEPLLLSGVGRGLSSLSSASKACSCTAIAVACRLCRVPAKPAHALPMQWLVVSVECQQSLMLMHCRCSGLSSLSSASAKACSCTTILQWLVVSVECQQSLLMQRLVVSIECHRVPAKPAHARPLQWLVVSVECQQSLLIHGRCSDLSSLSSADDPPRRAAGAPPRRRPSSESRGRP